MDETGRRQIPSTRHETSEVIVSQLDGKLIDKATKIVEPILQIQTSQ